MESVGVGRVLPGAVNAGGCTFSQGYYENRAFIVYASGPNVIILTEQLEWVQTLSSVSFGFPNVRTNCVHCADLGGKIAAGWGINVAIFQPVSNDGVGKLFPATWQLCDTLSLDGPVFSLCWKKSGNQLLVGGDSLTLWDSPKTRKESSLFSVNMKKIWSCRVASPIHYLKFSSDNHLFASAALNCRQVKVWFKQKTVESDDADNSKDICYGFIYLNHPNTVTGFMWRKLSPLMPVGHVSNVLLTYCVDNVCRLWKHHIKNRRRTRYSRLQFHIATTISPNSDIPFRSTMPVKDAPFTVHWLDNKEMAYTRRAEKVRKGYTGMLSHHPSISSLQSYQEANQDQSDVGWDYVESGFARSGSLTEDFDNADGDSSKYYSSDWCYNSYTPLQNKPAVHIGQCSIPTKDFLKFLDDWCNSADLLLCVHPNSGSLMIWTVEGLDSSSTCHRLAHVNFSSCLPHIFPPSDAFTLCQELLTFRHKPVLDSVASRNISCDNFDGLLAVDDADNPESSAASKPYSERVVDPASSLSVLSCHTNGSLNLWSVELGALPFTSVSGLIHVAHVSGHHSSITSVVKHPSLPVVISTSSVTEDREGELIVWRSGQLGVYSNKSRLTELSRISSSHPNSFKHVAWFPLLCNITSKSCIPIGGIFVTVVGNSLCLFESNFYSSYSVNKKRHSSLHAFDTVGKTHPTISTSALDISTFVGSNPLCFIGCLEKEFFSSKESCIIFMHVYPAGCFPSLQSNDEDGNIFYVLVLENVIPGAKGESYRSYSHIQTLAHLWKVVMLDNAALPVNNPTSPLVTSYPPVGSWKKQQTSSFGTSVESVIMNSQSFEVKSKKISVEPLVLPHGVYIDKCQSICDVQSSDISTSFSSFIFASSCSDGVLRFWQYKCNEEDSEKNHSWTRGVNSGIEFSAENTALGLFALSSLIPASHTFANSSCVAVVFYLSKPPQGDSDSPPNAQHALLTIWECISSASEKWSCQSRMTISCSAVSVKDTRSSAVLLEWIPVGNSRNVLACCFGSRLSLYSTINDSKDPWVLLCSGNVMQSDLRLDATLLSFVGNSNLITVTDCEFTIITLKSLSKNSHFTVDNVKDLILRKDTYSLLQEVYSNQSSLPEYHPQVLTGLISAGRLDLVKRILLNVSRYVIDTISTTSNDIDLDSFEYDYDLDLDDSKAHQRMLSISSEGVIIKSKKAKLINIEGTIPSVNLSQCSFMTEPDTAVAATAVNDDDDLFVTSPIEDYIAFSDDQTEPVDLSQFSPQVATRLLKVLQSYLLPGLTVVEQVWLAATIDTVANAKMSFSDSRPACVKDRSEVTVALSSGAGYAVGSGIKGGGEAMDDCGLRYLLKLKNHILYQDSIPKDAKRDVLSPQDIIWAFHSDAENDLLSSIPCVQSDKCSWPELREAGVGWWLRSNDTLRRLIEKVAKTQFSEKQEPLDASLFYLAMKKQNVLKLLFKNVGDERMMNFFKNDFTQRRWCTAALKNAFALLTKQRFEHAAAFFLLANKLWDAVEVCISRLHDLQLAFVIIRLYEGDGGPIYNQLLKENILGISVESKVALLADSNPFMRSIAYWLIQEYSESLETLLATSDDCMEDNDFATVFNFYIFLRSHPLLLRRKFAANGDKMSTKKNKCISSVGSEKWTLCERRLLFNTVLCYLQRGSPLVALDVLSKLPDEGLLLGDDAMSETIAHAETNMTDMIHKGTISSPRPKEKTDDDDIDWGQPVSTQLVEDDFDWSKPVTSQLQDDDTFDWSQPGPDGLEHLLSEEPSPPAEVKIEVTENNVCTDIVTHFRQLKFDACLTILTASLLSLQSSTVDNLRSALREWLSTELQAANVICRRSSEIVDNVFTGKDYKMISRLYWFICQQSDKPGILDCVKLELLLLLQDELKAISTTQDPSVEAWCRQEFPTCVMSPTNLPLLTCTMLPFAHPFSLAFHLKSLIQSIVECISNYSFPVSYMISKHKTSPLLSLCEVLSNCVSLTIGCAPCDNKSRAKAEHLFLQNDPSRWPGVTNWPNLLPSDEGRDPVRISVLLAECLVAVYLGLLADAWSEHKIGRLLYLTANCPSKEMWFRVFGGVLSFDPTKSSKKKSGTKAKYSKSQEPFGKVLAVFFPPWRTILNAFTSKPPDNTSINFKFPKEQKSVARLSNSELLADEDNPFTYAWSLMNTGITKIVKDAVKSSLAAAGMEIMELPVCSPLLHLAVKTLDSWEEGFQSQLESFGGAPSEMVDATSRRGQGPALLQHKSILEPDNSPFRLALNVVLVEEVVVSDGHVHHRSSTDNGVLACKMWEYLVKQEEIREMFIHNLFSDKSTSTIQDVGGTILYKDVDGDVATFCLNSTNPTVIAAATSRHIIEMDVTDILMNTDSYTITEEYCDLPVAKHNLTPNYPSAVNNEAEDFLVVHPARSPAHHNPFYSMGMDLQTGTSVNMLLRRDHAGVKELEAHPNLPYYLSGGQDGSIFMWEFANARPIVTHSSSGSSITKIRFTQQGNKFGVGDVTGRLHLWQGLHSNEKGPYQTLNCHSRTIQDFAFLSSSSFIATAGDSADNNNVCLWDTLLPDKRALVHKYTCLESGASAIAHSPSTQLLVAGGKHGHLSVFDIRHHVLLRSINAHNSAINCIVLNNIENYFVTASAEGEIKIWDLVKLTEISAFSGEHNRSRLFRSEGGVMQLFLTNDSTLYSSGADGSLKCRTLAVDT